VNIEVFQKLKDCRPGASFFCVYSVVIHKVYHKTSKKATASIYILWSFFGFFAHISDRFSPKKKITRGRTPRVLRAFFAGRRSTADLQKTARLSFYYRRDPVLITPDIRCHTAYLLCLKSSIDGNSEVFNFLL